MRAVRALLALPLIPVCVSAQALGILTGTVHAADGTPVAFARVSVVGSSQTALTNLAGGFELPLPPGSFLVHVRAIGYEVSLVTVDILAGKTSNVRAVLVLVPVGLAAVEVIGLRQPEHWLQGFEERRSRSEGHFFDRQDIARMQSRVITDVLRRVPGVHVQPVRGPYGSGEMVRMSRMSGVSGGRPCPVLYYVNGHMLPVTGDVPINDLVSMEDVVALEVYSGVSQIPPEFNATQHNARCGVIVIWTAVGSRDPDQP